MKFLRVTKYFILLIPFFYLFSTSTTIAQRETNIWYFGYGAGLDFNSGKPIPLTNGAIYQDEGCATICDKNGKLLFYTDGSTIWNNNHKIMPNGSGLFGNSSASQSGIIVPKPKDQNIYYVFTVEAIERNLYGFNYSIVDLMLDGGRGDITLKNINLLPYDNYTEKVTSIKHSNGSSYWIVTHGFNNNNFYAYKLTDSGLIINPVISSVGFNVQSKGQSGYLKASSNGKLIAYCSYGPPFFELLEFDATNGTVSKGKTSFNQILSSCAYGLEFSPDNSKLYVSTLCGESRIYQYDLKSGTDSAIILSKTIITPNIGAYGSLQLGPDSKIYIAYSGRASLSVIDYPNLKGLSCQFKDDAVPLNGKICMYGLPNFIPSLITQSDQIYIGSTAEQETYQNNIALQIYPNPSNSSFKFEININKLFKENDGILEIFDLLGKRILYKNIQLNLGTSRFSFEIADLKSGLYFARISYYNYSVTSRILYLK